MAAGGIAAILASVCCLGPLVLVTLGVSGAWMGNLAALETYRPLFIGAALVAMFFAWRRIFQPAEKCQPDAVRAALKRVPGVEKVDIEAGQKRVTAACDDSKTDSQALTRATENAGYLSSVVPH